MSQPRAGWVAMLVLLAGCTVGPDYRPPTLSLSPAYLAAASIAAPHADATWWQAFQDPLLVSLLERAVQGNTDLARVQARILRARAVARAAGAALLPRVDADGGAERVEQSLDTALGHVTTELGLPRDYSEYDLGLRASWELDLAGGLRRGHEAAGADAAAAAADAGAARIAIEAETADSYLLLRALQAELGVTREQEDNEALLVELVRQRVGQGVSPERDLNRSLGAWQGVRAQLAPLQAAIEAQLNRLDVLLGEPPGSNHALLAEVRALPVAPAPAGSTAPQDLLRHRPDIWAAERRLAASHARSDQAVAEYYPHVSLSGLIGVASLTTGALFTQPALQSPGSAGLRWRLFDFGRVDAEIAAARGREAESLAAWRGSVLHAAEDVETALARLAEAHHEREALELEVAALTRARDQSRQAYEGGVIGLIAVTDTDRELLFAANRLAEVRGSEARQAVFAYRALGGGWSADRAPALAAATPRRQERR